MSFLQVAPMGGRKGSAAMKAKMARLRSMRKGGIEVGGYPVGGIPVGGRRRGRGGAEMLVTDPMADYPRVGAGRMFMNETLNPDVGGRMNYNMTRKMGGINVGGFKKGQKADAVMKARIAQAKVENARLRAEGLMPARGQKRVPLSSEKQVRLAVKRLLFPSKAVENKYEVLNYDMEIWQEILAFILDEIVPQFPTASPEYLKLVKGSGRLLGRGGKWYDDLISGVKTGVDIGSKILPFVL
jgi:hypothetical protein